jgi:hypothetical protein
MYKLAAVIGLVGGLTKSSFSTHLKAIDLATTKVADEVMSEAAKELFQLAATTDGIRQFHLSILLFLLYFCLY